MQKQVPKEKKLNVQNLKNKKIKLRRKKKHVCVESCCYTHRTETNTAPLLPALGLPCNPSSHYCNVVFPSFSSLLGINSASSPSPELGLQHRCRCLLGERLPHNLLWGAEPSAVSSSSSGGCGAAGAAVPARGQLEISQATELVLSPGHRASLPGGTKHPCQGAPGFSSGH